MSKELEYELTYKINNLNKLISLFNKVIQTDMFSSEEKRGLVNSISLVDSKKATLTIKRDNLRELRRATSKTKDSDKKKKDRKIKIVELNPKITVKSSTVEIKGEIERLKRVQQKATFPNAVRQKIRTLKIELGHRESGFRKPPHIIQGGSTGLKK